LVEILLTFLIMKSGKVSELYYEIKVLKVKIFRENFYPQICGQTVTTCGMFENIQFYFVKISRVVDV